MKSSFGGDLVVMVHTFSVIALKPTLVVISVLNIQQTPLKDSRKMAFDHNADLLGSSQLL